MRARRQGQALIGAPQRFDGVGVKHIGEAEDHGRGPKLGDRLRELLLEQSQRAVGRRVHQVADLAREIEESAHRGPACAEAVAAGVWRDVEHQERPPLASERGRDHRGQCLNLSLGGDAVDRHGARDAASRRGLEDRADRVGSD